MDAQEVVREYERLGLKCFPVKLDKRPFESWEACRTETTEQRLARFERTTSPHLIAAIPGEQFVVIDIDDPQAFRAFLNGEPVEFLGPCVVTPSGGLHYWCRQAHDLRCLYAALPWGELRTGEKHYVIVPGGCEAAYQKGGKSIRGAYQWAPGTTPLTEWQGELPPLPPEFLARLQDNGKPSEKSPEVLESIPEGTRNNRLLSMAGAMRRQGMDESAILAALTVANDRCSPPLPEKEVESIAKSVCRYAPAPPDTLTRLTDAGSAELFAELFGDRVRYDHKRQRWLLWGTDWWTDDAEKGIRDLAVQAARERQRRAADLENQDTKQAVFHYGVSSENRAKIDNMLYMAVCQKAISDSGEGWDADPYLFGVANGVLDLRTGTLRPGRPTDRISRHSDIPFDPHAKASRWVQFVDEVFNGDPDLIEFLQRLGGYSLTGDVSEPCVVFLHGSGANGKSTLISTLKYVWGRYSYTLPFRVFDLSNRDGIPAEIAALDRVRLALITEIPITARLHEGRIKDLCGGDCINARHLYKDPFEFNPVAKLWLAGNHKPTVIDDSDALWRRMYLLPFNRQFKGDNADPTLPEKLKAEAPGILTWAVEGCLYWQQNRLRPPEVVKTATQQYREESDPLADFIADRCTLDENASVQPSDLYREYAAWAEAGKLRKGDILSNTAFGRRIGERFTKTRSVGRLYHGISLKNDSQTHF